MDVQGIVIGFAVFLLSGVIIYAISVLTMREKTFEEVLEEQRSNQQAVLGKPKSLKDKKDKKKPKPKKSKAKTEGGSNVEPESGANVEEPVMEKHKMVQLEIDPEIIPEKIDPVEEQTTRKRKTKSAKSILVNKGEPVMVKANLKAEVEVHTKVPLDDVELKHERQRRDSHNSTSSVEHKTIKKEKNVVLNEEPILAATTAPVTSAAPTAQSATAQGKKAKKNKNARSVSPAGGDVVLNGGDTGTGGGSLTSVVKAIQSASLSEGDTQALLDQLLSNQPHSWTKKPQKGDPQVALKKEIDEKEQKISELQSSLSHMRTQLAGAQSEVVAEKQRLEGAERMLQQRRGESEAMHARMQQTHEQHNKEMANLRRQCEQVHANQAQLPTLLEENRQLKEANARASAVDVSGMQLQLKMLQEELNKSVMRCNQSDGARDIAERKAHRYEEQLRDLSQQVDSGKMMTTKVAEVSEELRRAQAHKEKTLRVLEQARAASEELAKEKSAMQSKVTNLEMQQQGLDKKAKESEEERRRLESELNSVKQSAEAERRRLEEQVSVLSQLQQQQSAASPAPEQQALQQEQLQQAHSTLATVQSEKSELQSRVDGLGQEMATLRTELDAQRKKNDELRKRNGKAMEALCAAEKRADCISAIKSDMEQKDNIIAQLRAQLERSQVEAQSAEAERRRLEEQVSVLSQQQQSAASPAPEQQALQQEQLQQAHSTLATVQSEKSELQSRVDGLGQEMATLRTELDAQRKKNDSLQSELSASLNAQQELATLREQLSAETSRLTSKSSELDGVSQQLSSKTSELESLRVQLESQTAQLDTYKQQVNDLQSKDKQMAEESSKSSALWQQLQELQQQREEGLAVIAKLQALVDALTKDKQELKAASESAQAVAGEKTALEQRVAALSEELKGKESELQGLTDSLDSLKETNLAVERQKEEAVEAHFGEVDSLNTEISRLLAQLQQVKESHESELQGLKQQNAVQQERVSELETAVASSQQVAPPSGEAAEQQALTLLTEHTHTSFTSITEITRILTRYESDRQQLKQLQSEIGAKDTLIKEMQEQMVELGRAAMSKEVKEDALLVQLNKEFAFKGFQIINKTPEVEKLTEIIKEYFLMNTELKERIESLESRAPGEQAGDVSAAVARQQELEALVASKEKQLADMDAKLQLSQDDVRDTATQLNQLQVQLQRMNSSDAKLHSLQEDLEAKTAQNASLQKKLNTLESSLNAASRAPAATEAASGDESKLQAEVLHYKNVLANTEDILKRLQSSVESEEKRWTHKLKTAETELNKTRDELRKARAIHEGNEGSIEDLTDLDFAYRCVEKSLSTIVDEMEDKVKELEMKLQSAETENKSLNQELSSLRGRLDDGQVAPPSPGGSNLNQQLVKLKAQVKFGEDALRQEQELVKSLQEQLSKNKQSIANGTSPVDETKELRARLHDTQSQLEQEMQANKQLVNKLAASVASEGTSV